MGHLIWSPRLPLPNEFDPQVDRTARPVTDPGNRCQWCLVSQVIWCCLALMSGKMCGRHLGGIFLCAHERIPRGLGRFSFSKAWRAVSGGEARKLSFTVAALSAVCRRAAPQISQRTSVSTDDATSKTMERQTLVEKYRKKMAHLYF